MHSNLTLLLQVLGEVFPRKWELAGARFGWGLVITAALFAAGHGVLLDASLHLRFSAFAVVVPLLSGVLLGWLRERTGSVWPGIVVHNLVDGLPLLATWLVASR